MKDVYRTGLIRPKTTHTLLLAVLVDKKLSRVIKVGEKRIMKLSEWLQKKQNL